MSYYCEAISVFDNSYLTNATEHTLCNLLGRREGAQMKQYLCIKVQLIKSQLDMLAN